MYTLTFSAWSMANYLRALYSAQKVLVRRTRATKMGNRAGLAAEMGDVGMLARKALEHLKATPNDAVPPDLFKAYCQYFACTDLLPRPKEQPTLAHSRCNNRDCKICRDPATGEVRR